MQRTDRKEPGKEVLYLHTADRHTILARFLKHPYNLMSLSLSTVVLNNYLYYSRDSWFSGNLPLGKLPLQNDALLLICCCTRSPYDVLDTNQETDTRSKRSSRPAARATNDPTKLQQLATRSNNAWAPGLHILDTSRIVYCSIWALIATYAIRVLADTLLGHGRSRQPGKVCVFPRYLTALLLYTWRWDAREETILE